MWSSLWPQISVIYSNKKDLRIVHEHTLNWLKWHFSHLHIHGSGVQSQEPMIRNSSKDGNWTLCYLNHVWRILFSLFKCVLSSCRDLKSSPGPTTKMPVSFKSLIWSKLSLNHMKYIIPAQCKSPTIHIDFEHLPLYPGLKANTAIR